MMKNCRTSGLSAKAVIIMLVSCFLVSCQAVDTQITDKDMQDLSASQEAPKPNITRYDSSLKIFGKMLAAYNADYVMIQSKPITDATAAGGVPKNLQQMVISALNKIGPRIKYLDYDPQYVLTQDALAERMDPNNRAAIVMQTPDILVSGAITEYDKGLINKSNSMNVDIAGSVTGNEVEAGIGADSDAGTSRIAVDLQLVDFYTQQLLSGEQTSMSITISQKSSEKEFGFAMFGSGFGISGTIKQKQGLHSAIRLLIETSVLALMGEHYKVPYWRCVEGAEPNEDVINAYREMLETEDNDAFTTRLKVLAYAHGYDMNLMDLRMNESEVEIYQNLKQQYNVTDDVDLITNLWMTVPIKNGAKRLRKARRQMAKSAPAPQEVPVQQQAPAMKQATPVTASSAGQENVTSSAPPKPAPVANSAPAKKTIMLFGTMSDDDFDNDDF